MGWGDSMAWLLLRSPPPQWGRSMLTPLCSEINVSSSAPPAGTCVLRGWGSVGQEGGIWGEIKGVIGVGDEEREGMCCPGDPGMGG